MIYELLLLLLAILMVGLVLYWVLEVGPTRRAANKEKDIAGIQARESHMANQNHLGLFLLVNDLLAIHQIGYQVVYPDEETLARAKQLTADYRKEVSQ